MEAQKSHAAPIACTLGAGAYQERLAWIAELNRSELQSSRREGARLILTYGPGAGRRIREMMRREHECCAFLGFELNEDEKGLTLVITAPEAAWDALDAVFDPFLTGSNPGSGYACAPGVTMTDARRPKPGSRGASIAASAAGVAATGALACAACCILPFALPAAALAVAGGTLAWLASLYEGAIVAATVLVATAWIWVVRQSQRTRKRPAATTVLVMLAASTMLALAYCWPIVEPIVIAKLVAR